MNIVESYYYVFYSFYKLFNRFDQTRWLLKQKAAICIGCLELGIYFSVVNYTDVLLKHNSVFGLIPFIVVSTIIFLKWFAFFKDENWKKYMNSFDNWPTKKNITSSWIVLALVIVILINFFVSCLVFSPLRG